MEIEENAESNDILAKVQDDKSHFNENNTWRSTLAQFTAGWIICLSTASIGMMISFPTIAIGELHKSEDDFLLSEEQASWFGSMIFLLQPICSILGGLVQTYIGRKYGMMMTYVPQLAAWVLLSSAKSVLVLYVAVVLFGVSAGSMEAPGIAYLGEITQPRIRGKITCSANIFYGFGSVILYFLGTVASWRTVAGICAVLPAVFIVTIFFIPDSPIWLLSKGREADALKALCWLRGWVPPENVQFEYKSMCHYIEASKQQNHGKSESKYSFFQKLRNTVSLFTRPAIRKPFILIAVSHFACHGAALGGMRSYFIDVFRIMQIQMNPELLTFLGSILMIFGGIICFLVVRLWGKRFTFLFSLMICSLICMILSLYTLYMDQMRLEWIPVVSILFVHLAMAVGLYPIPWMLTSEVFPLKGRSVSAGLVAAASYILAFVFSKTFYTLNNSIHLHGCFLVYGLCGIFGFIYLYFELPETEGKTLVEIEEYFTPPNKKQKLDI